MTLPVLPIVLVDLLGSTLMILLSFGCVRLSLRLRRRRPDHLIWVYLFWVCCFLAGFAVSRSAGHILKQGLLFWDRPDLWEAVRPYSGAVNTTLLIMVSALTLFCERVWRLYREIQTDRAALRKTHAEVMALNQGLERRVRERTEALARSEKQVAQADRLASIGQLASGIAHEINNPLGIILGYTQLMLRSGTEDTQDHEDLKTIEKHVKNCKAIVEDLLDFARGSAPALARLDIHAVVEEAVSFVRSGVRDDRMEVIRDFDPAVPPVLMDGKKIRQVLVNLLMNARHAMDGTGRVTVSTRYPAGRGWVVLKVTDTGHGIEARHLPRIFDPFFTTKPTGVGTGLGLSVSYGIVKSHGGEISVESEPGQGATFIVTLPVDGPETEGEP